MTEGLGKLLTDLGERSTYDAVSQCSRCGYCEQACPTYVATGEESKSPRGRNQILRLILEGKLKGGPEAEEALSTCLLCGACQSACYAHVPVPDLVLEARRLIGGKPHWVASTVTGLMVRGPARLESLLKLSYFFKRIGLSRLARPLLRLVGLPGLAEADEHVKEVPKKFLKEELSGRLSSKDSRWSYFAACGTNYLFPRVGLATVEVLEKTKGPGGLLETGCCGLLCYNYGELADARILAKKVIEDASASEEDIVVDCSSCAAFLKSYPQLFLDDPDLKARAEKFAKRIKDVVEIIDDIAVSAPCASSVVDSAYHQSCRACHGQGLKPPPGAKLLPESDACCGGAGAFAFVHPELSDEVLRRKIGTIASTQARRVLASSTSCLIQLAAGLRKYYPDCEVLHVSESVRERLPHGTTTGA